MAKQSTIAFLFALVIIAVTGVDAGRMKRMYAMCPPSFQRIGNECYFISKERVNWLDAHFECKDRNSRLAEPYKHEDRLLRKFLMRADKSRADIWIGGIFNWEKNKWQWGYNGHDMTYQSFSQMSPGNKQDLKFHCAVLNPKLKYRWSARSCVDKHHYVCQHRMPFVNEKNRLKVYNKWNATFPNEMANEVEEVINEDELIRRRNRVASANRQNKLRLNNIRNERLNRTQIQLDDRQSNRIPINNRRHDQLNHPRRRLYRPRQTLLKKDVLHKQFETQLNQNRLHRPRNEIQFGNEAVPRRRIHQRRKNRPTTTTTEPTTTTSTTTAAPTTTLSLDDFYRRENERQMAEDQRRIEQEEIRRYEEKLRRQQEEEQLRIKEEERRIYEENEKRARQLKEMERQRQLEKEKRDREDEERRHRQQIEREEEDQRRQQEHEDEERQRQEQRRQHEERLFQEQQQQQEQHDATKLPPVESNDVIQPETTTRASVARTTIVPEVLQPSTNEISPEEKKRRRQLLRQRLQKLSPEEQREFFKKRAERGRTKKGVNHHDSAAVAAEAA